jgi:hypothetical protein
MDNRKIRFGSMIAALVFAGGACFGVSYSALDARSQTMAASATEKSDGRRDLDLIVKSLQAVDVSYAAGNAAEAQARFGEALSGWNRISRIISAREAREQQLLFDSLGNQLKTSVPATEIKATVTGMIEELNDDIRAELK